MSRPQPHDHDQEDNFGVVLVDGLAAITEMLCVVTADNSDFTLNANDEIPIGHNVACEPMPAGCMVRKYGENSDRKMAPETQSPRQFSMTKLYRSS